jgi:RNA recognition motif-containing protein
MKLYVGNLSFTTSETELNELFSAEGTVESCRIITDRDTGRSRGFGFVEMGSQAEGQAAIQKMNGLQIDGRALTVNVAKPMEPRNGGGNARGGRGGGSGSRW